MEIYGRVDTGTSAFVTSTNLHGGNHQIVDDTCKLSQKTKNAIVRELKTNKRNVVYLIQKDKTVAMGLGRLGETTQKRTNPGSSKGKNSVRKSYSTSYKNFTSKKAIFRDNNSFW